MLGSVAPKTKEAVLASSGLDSEPLVPEPIAQPVHVGITQLEVPLSSELKLSIPKPNIQPTLTNVESLQPVPSHKEHTGTVSHLMDLDVSHESFDSTIIKEKMSEVSRAITMKESSQV